MPRADVAAYLVTLVHRVTDPVGYGRYKAAVPDLVARHGGEYVVRSSDLEVLEGSLDTTRVLVLRFPDRAAVDAMFCDADYLAIADLRRGSTTATILVVAD